MLRYPEVLDLSASRLCLLYSGVKPVEQAVFEDILRARLRDVVSERASGQPCRATVDSSYRKLHAAKGSIPEHAVFCVFITFEETQHFADPQGSLSLESLQLGQHATEYGQKIVFPGPKLVQVLGPAAPAPTGLIAFLQGASALGGFTVGGYTEWAREEYPLLLGEKLYSAISDAQADEEDELVDCE